MENCSIHTNAKSASHIGPLSLLEQELDNSLYPVHYPHNQDNPSTVRVKVPMYMTVHIIHIMKNYGTVDYLKILQVSSITLNSPSLQQQITH